MIHYFWKASWAFKREWVRINFKRFWLSLQSNRPQMDGW